MADSFRSLTWIMMALGVSEEPGEGHLGALVASGVLSGGKEADEEDQHRSQAEAWEGEALSYLEAQGDLKERWRGGGL